MRGDLHPDQLATGGSATFGFIVDGTVTGATGFALNGTVCTATV